MHDKISEIWSNLAQKEQSTANFINSSVKRNLGHRDAGEPEVVMFFNKNLDINRFFIEDSDGQKGSGEAMNIGEMPKVEGSIGAGGANVGPSSGFTDTSDPFEEDLEDALCVFKAGDSNKDIMEKNEKLIMFYIDLENEEIISNEPTEENKNGGDNQDQLNESKHPVLFNQYPICKNHSLMLLFADAGLP